MTGRRRRVWEPHRKRQVTPTSGVLRPSTQRRPSNSDRRDSPSLSLSSAATAIWGTVETGAAAGAPTAGVGPGSTRGEAVAASGGSREQIRQAGQEGVVWEQPVQQRLPASSTCAPGDAKQTKQTDKLTTRIPGILVRGPSPSAALRFASCAAVSSSSGASASADKWDRTGVVTMEKGNCQHRET